ncbi:unnamed protein product, partial [Sphenostylis stenocarpa]
MLEGKVEELCEMEGRALPFYRDSHLSGRDRCLEWQGRDGRLVIRDGGLVIEKWRDGRLANRDGGINLPNGERVVSPIGKKSLPTLIWGLIVYPRDLVGHAHLQIGGLLLFILRSGKIWGLDGYISGDTHLDRRIEGLVQSQEKFQRRMLFRFPLPALSSLSSLE